MHHKKALLLLVVVLGAFAACAALRTNPEPPAASSSLAPPPSTPPPSPPSPSAANDTDSTTDPDDDDDDPQDPIVPEGVKLAVKTFKGMAKNIYKGITHAVRAVSGGIDAAAKAFVAATSSPFPAHLCFPLDKASYKARKNDFGNGRSQNKRCHAGNDILTKKPGNVVAIDDGEVTKIISAFLQCKNGWAGAGKAGSVLIFHPSINMTVNYGEIDTKKILVKAGQNVTKGQALGRAGHCGMLHFELYAGRVDSNERWWPSAACVNAKCKTGPVKRANWCVDDATAFARKPAALLDPRPLIDFLAGKYCS